MLPDSRPCHDRGADSSNELHTLTFNALGDWRGKWVAATMTRNRYIGFASGPSILSESLDELSTTSEFSRAVKVE